MYRLTRWNEKTEMAELIGWDTEEEWKEFMEEFDVPIWASLAAAIDKLAEYEDLEEQGKIKLCEDLDEDYLVTGVEDGWIKVDKETWKEYLEAKKRLHISENEEARYITNL